ncbi:MAG: heavy metal response regulator transcription factor [Pseudomonadota bacterium]|nr:heavy metal response regulator transcription factor [Pseudomonadota bacterium]
MRTLLVEDDPKTLSYLSRGLNEHGFISDIAKDGEEGLHLALTGPYDLIILDVMLPRLDGWAVLAGIRAAGKNLPILMLTARDKVEDRVKGLELGADDYLVKPFAFSELVARMRSLMRRGTGQHMDRLSIAGLDISFLRHQVSRDGKVIDLSAKEFQLLAFLARHQGEVLSRTLIAEQVWDIHFECDSNIVDVAIRRLRRKVDDPFGVKLIRTVHGIGYVLDDVSAPA